MSTALNALNNIDVDVEFNSGDPIERLEQLEKLFYDLRTAVASSEQEIRKSKKAAELLLAELNEVQERNDVLQEELATAVNEVAELTKERDLSEAAKLDAISRLESLSTVRSEERKNQLSEFMGIKSGLNQLRRGFHDVNSLLADVFSKDLEFLHNLEASIDSCLKTNNVEQVVVPFFSGSDGFITGNSESKVLLMLIYLFVYFCTYLSIDGHVASILEILSLFYLPQILKVKHAVAASKNQFCLVLVLEYIFFLSSICRDFCQLIAFVA